MSNSTMSVKNGQLEITVDGDALKLDQEFVTRAIHDKLYNVSYRKTRNARIALLVAKGKEVEAAEALVAK